jgi:hypothetical protein
LTAVKNKLKHPKACFTIIEYHLCHTDDQRILAAVVLPVSTSKKVALGSTSDVKSPPLSPRALKFVARALKASGDFW